MPATVKSLPFNLKSTVRPITTNMCTLFSLFSSIFFFVTTTCLFGSLLTSVSWSGRSAVLRSPFVQQQSSVSCLVVRCSTAISRSVTWPVGLLIYEVSCSAPLLTALLLSCFPGTRLVYQSISDPLMRRRALWLTVEALGAHGWGLELVTSGSHDGGRKFLKLFEGSLNKTTYREPRALGPSVDAQLVAAMEGRCIDD